MKNRRNAGAAAREGYDSGGKNEWKWSRYIKNMDMFGYPVHFSFDNGKTGGHSGVFMAQPTHQTCLGGLLTLGFIAVVVLSLLNGIPFQNTEIDARPQKTHPVMD